MTDIASLRTYLKEVVGLGRNQEGIDRADAIIREGLEKISDLIDLADEDGVKTRCNNVQKPSGTVPQPGWIAPDPNPTNLSAPQVPKPGQVIPSLCEQRLITAAYGAKLYASIGRTTISADMLSKSRLREIKSHQVMVNNLTEPESLPDLSKTFTLPKFLNQFPTYLRELLGTTKIALSYIVREEEDPPSPLPQLLPSKPWSSLHTSLMDELISFAPHTGPTYDADNARVYTLLVHHLAGSSALVSTTRW